MEGPDTGTQYVVLGIMLGRAFSAHVFKVLPEIGPLPFGIYPLLYSCLCLAIIAMPQNSFFQV